MARNGIRFLIVLVCASAARCASSAAVPRPFPSPGAAFHHAPAPAPGTRAGPGRAWRGCGNRAGSSRGTLSQWRQRSLRLRLQRLRLVCLRAAMGSACRARWRSSSRRVAPSARRTCSPAIWCSSKRAPDRASHVGVVVGGDEFVHAPSSRGEVRVELWRRPTGPAASLERDGCLSSETGSDPGLTPEPTERSLRCPVQQGVRPRSDPTWGLYAALCWPLRVRRRVLFSGELADVEVVLRVELWLCRAFERLDSDERLRRRHLAALHVALREGRKIPERGRRPRRRSDRSAGRSRAPGTRRATDRDVTARYAFTIRATSSIEVRAVGTLGVAPVRALHSGEGRSARDRCDRARARSCRAFATHVGAPG